MKRGILENNVLVDSPKVLSVVEILTSSYGHPRNATKTYDISSKLRQMIERQVRKETGHDVSKNKYKVHKESRHTRRCSMLLEGLVSYNALGVRLIALFQFIVSLKKQERELCESRIYSSPKT